MRFWLNKKDKKSSLRGQIVEEDVNNTGVPCVVYLPPGYDDDDGIATMEYEEKINRSEQQEQKKEYCPILYHLHGAGASYSGVKQHTSAIGQSLEANDVKMIVVCPYDPTSFSMWVDGSNIDIASKIHNHMIPHIENKYAVQADKSSRFIQGFSMGGFGAAAHGLKYPQKFGKVIIWDGALHDWTTLSTMRKFIASRQFKNSEELFSEWSPYDLAKSMSSSSSSLPSILMFSGGMSITDKLASNYKTTLDESNISDVVHVRTKIGHNLKDFLKLHDRDAFDFLGVTSSEGI